MRLIHWYHLFTASLEINCTDFALVLSVWLLFIVPPVVMSCLHPSFQVRFYLLTEHMSKHKMTKIIVIVLLA